MLLVHKLNVLSISFENSDSNYTFNEFHEKINVFQSEEIKALYKVI